MASIGKLISRIPRKLISAVLLLAILIFLALYLKGIQWDKLAHINIQWSWLLMASLVALFCRYASVFIWRVIMQSLGVKKLPPFAVMASVFAKAWMARYIPGTVTWVVGRIYLASAYGISKSRLTVSSLLEGGMQVVTGIAIALPMIGFDNHAGHISWQVKLIVVIISLAFLAALLPPFFNRLLHAAHFVIKRKKPNDELRVNGDAVLRSFILFSVVSIISGFSSYLVARSVDPSLGYNTVWYLIGAFSLAGAVGIATPFLPSGIGVRDGIQLVLLSLIMPRELALVITVLSRLWGVAVDAIFFGVAFGWFKSHHYPPIPQPGQVSEESAEQ